MPADSAVPPWATSNNFSSITRTDDELSIVCPSENVPQQYRDAIQWVCFKLEGPFPFSSVGILESFIAPLADAKIPIFAVSTYETDYVLVKEEDAERAIEVLQNAGHLI
ncbi:MAG: ACT domain-containing protein [Acidobacteriaceae bacterium]|nr:ACT domain-containing protein [Acidobacteriaceae bacterium]